MEVEVPTVSRVVVIGGGVGGLAVAARLARMRHDVTLVERSDTAGGKLGEWRHDGFRFDTGPSLVTLPATLRDLFIKTGRPLDDVLELQSLDTLAHYRFPDGTEMELPNSGVHGIASAFQDVLGGSAGRDWMRFHERAERMWTLVRTPFVESPLAGPSALATLALRRPVDMWRIAPWRSLRAVGRASFDDPRQVLFLDRYATYTGSDPGGRRRCCRWCRTSSTRSAGGTSPADCGASRTSYGNVQSNAGCASSPAQKWCASPRRMDTSTASSLATANTSPLTLS